MSRETPELPNFIQLIYNNNPTHPWALWMHEWEDLLFSLIVGVGLVIIFYLCLRKRALIPHGFQNLIEHLLENFQQLIDGVLGSEGKKHLPFLGTLFFYILGMNWIGILPLMKSPSSSVNATAALAITVFCYVQFLNIKNLGVFGFLYHLAGSPKGAAGWMLVPLIFPIELLTQLSRPITLALRLFGNIFGEHILLAVFAVLGVITIALTAIEIALPFQIPFLFLALLTGLMQALVFTMLTTVYILLSFPHRKENHS